MGFHYPIGAGGGGGTIQGTIDVNQIAYGTALDTIGGSANATWSEMLKSIQAGNGNTMTGSSSFAFGDNNFVEGVANWALGVSNTVPSTARRAGAIGFAMTVDATDSIGINLDGGTPVTLAQDNVFSVMNGLTGLGTLTPKSTLHVQGSTSYKHVTTSIDYTVLLTDNYIGTVPVPPIAIIITLPSVASAAIGKEYIIKDQIGGANVGTEVTITPQIGETIDGAATEILSIPYSSRTIRCTGNGWAII